MPFDPNDIPNVTKAVPFFRVRDIDASLAFYVEGLGCKMRNSWSPQGKVRWCWLELGQAPLMLQSFKGDEVWAPEGPLGQGLSIAYQCGDAIAIWRDARRKGLEASTPFVGNGLWVTFLTDPDGYRLEFHSPTDAPEEAVWSEPEEG